MKDVSEIGRPLRITATNATLNSNGFVGILVASSTAGSIAISDSTGVILNTMVLPVGFTPLKIRSTGATTITVAGTLDATLILVE
jgi:hypothetical protein